MARNEQLVLYKRVPRQGRLRVGSELSPVATLQRNDYRRIKGLAGRELNNKEVKAVEAARENAGVAARDLVVKRESAPHRVNFLLHRKGERHTKPLSTAGYKVYRDGLKTLEHGATKSEAKSYADSLYRKALGEEKAVRRASGQPIANWFQRMGVRFYANPSSEVRKVVEGLMGQTPSAHALSLVRENVTAAIKVNFDEHNTSVVEKGLKVASNLVRKPIVNFIGSAESGKLDVGFDVIDTVAAGVDGKTRHEVAARTKLTAVDLFLSRVVAKNGKWSRLARIARVINNVGILNTGFDQGFDVSQRALINLALDGMTNPHSPFAAHREALAEAVLGAKGIFGQSLTDGATPEAYEQAEAAVIAANHKPNAAMDAYYRLSWRALITQAAEAARTVKNFDMAAVAAVEPVAEMPEVTPVEA